ncbi:MAG TPA: TIGR03032 family protein [Micropepsaceae bacterium]|nr:TIGR03032 family protein [Micropepsaceae bacterium]
MEQLQQGFTFTHSRHFADWLSEIGSSLAFTTYQAGKLCIVGLNAAGIITAFERTFERSMGIGFLPRQRSFFLATKYQLVRFDEFRPKGKNYEGWDVLFAPHQTWITGDIDIHDVAALDDSTPIFVNTSFSCLATVSPGFSFKPTWWPPFISRLAPEDRCHLNGMALEGGTPRYATLVAASDVTDGWRERRAEGGVVWDIAAGKPLAQGLSMPHSPVLHEGRLWLLNSGTGEFGFIRPGEGKFNAVAFCPGYARGLAIIGRYAVIGLSLFRENTSFQGLVLERTLTARGAEPRCGVIVVDLDSGNTIEWLRMDGVVVKEIFDVAVLPGVRNAALIGFLTNEVERLIMIDESQQPKRI